MRITSDALSRRAKRLRLTLGLVLAVLAAAPAIAFAQPPVHYFQDSRLPLGAIGQGQVARHPRMVGYYQPVEIMAPKGVLISTATAGQFDEAETAPLKVGLMVGQVYRFRVSGVRFHEGEEIFPSIEVINRLHPPEGKALRFPIPVELTEEELTYALEGRYVTRVIYIEAPPIAFTGPRIPGQRFIEAGGDEDPLRMADDRGRPMAILRMGSRVPDIDEDTGKFTFGSPPFQRYPAQITDAAKPDNAPASNGRGVEPSMGAIPRLPLPGPNRPGLLLGRPPSFRGPLR